MIDLIKEHFIRLTNQKLCYKAKSWDFIQEKRSLQVQCLSGNLAELIHFFCDIILYKWDDNIRNSNMVAYMQQYDTVNHV